MSPAEPANTRFAWDSSQARLLPEQQPGEVLAVDSWLVADGRMRLPEAHTARFTEACARLGGPAPAVVRAFVAAALGRIPVPGRWFPRVELVAEGGVGRSLRLWLRPAPPRTSTVALWVADEPDTRREPRTKGPDLDHLSRLRSRAVAAGGDEALILGPDGSIREGSTTSVLWWRGDSLRLPPADHVLPGTTRAALAAAVSAAPGLDVAEERAVPADLDGLEVWTVNALHGIRPVNRWVGAEVTPGQPERATRWSAYLDTLAVPLPVPNDGAALPV